MKNSMIVSLVATILFGTFADAVLAQSESESDETRLRMLHKEVDKDLNQGTQGIGGRGSKLQVEMLAWQFHVPASLVEGLRSKKQSWGAITIELAMAQHLSKLDPISHRTVTEALQRVQGLRDERKGWGVIAKELGFKLGPVISDVQRARQGLRAERERLRDQLKAEKLTKKAYQTAKAEQAAEGVERLERSGR